MEIEKLKQTLPTEVIVEKEVIKEVIVEKIVEVIMVQEVQPVGLV